MEEKDIGENKDMKKSPTMEEQIEFVKELTRRSEESIKKIKEEFPEVVECVKKGRP